MKEKLLRDLADFHWNISFKGKKQSEGKPVLCPSLDCVNGVDEENFGQTCERCKGLGHITYPDVVLGKQNNKMYATVELDYLLELARGGM